MEKANELVEWLRWMKKQYNADWSVRIVLEEYSGKSQIK